MARKMLLVDPRLLETIQHKPYVPPDTVTDSLRELDELMQTVLEREDLSPRDKARMYQRSLHRYMTRLDQYRNKPLGLVDTKPSPTVEPTPRIDRETEPNLQSRHATSTKTPEKEPEVKTPENQLIDKPPIPKTPEKKTAYALRRRSQIPTPKWLKWPRANTTTTQLGPGRMEG